MFTEATSGLDDRIQQMALAIEKLTKSLEEKDAQVATRMHKLELQNLAKEDQENLDLPKLKIWKSKNANRNKIYMITQLFKTFCVILLNFPLTLYLSTNFNI